MQLFCQSCQAAFTATTHCPRCGSRLLSPQESFIHAGTLKKPPPDPIPATFGNRLTMGVLAALGLAFGLRELASAFALTSGGEVSEFWADANTQPQTLVFRLIAVFCGGLLAGAGRGRGVQIGAATGLIFGTIITSIDLYAAGRVNDLIAVLLALAYPVVGAIAGAVGAWLWPANAILPEVITASSHGSSIAALASEDAERHRVRPTAWLRILAGAVVILIGCMASDPIRLALAKYSSGWLNTGGHSKAAWIGLEIAAIMTLLGGLIAGAGTGAGLKHGLFAAILAGVGLIFGSTNRPNGLYPAVEGYLNLIPMTLEPLTTPGVAVAVLGGLIVLSTMGGWLGGQLILPIAPRAMRKQRLRRQT